MSILSKAVLISLMTLQIGYFETCVGQDDESQRKTREIIQRSKSRSTNRDALKLRVRICRPYFQLDHDLQIANSGVTESFLKSDRLFYEYILTGVLGNLGLSQLEQEQNRRSALAIKSQWKLSYGNYLDSGDVRLIDSFEQELKQYDEELLNDLDPKSIAILEQAVDRDRIMTLGLPRFIKTNKDLSNEQKTILLDALVTLSKEIKLEGNEIFVDNAKSLFPMLLEEFAIENVNNLNVLPLSCFLANLSNREIAENRARKMIAEFDIDVKKGQWQFPSVYFENRGGLTTPSKRSFDSLIPESALMQISARPTTPLSDSQHRALVELFHNRHLTNYQAGNRAEQREEIFYHRKRVSNWIEKNILPAQAQSISDFLKLHMLFTCGPSAVWQELDSDTRIGRSEFEKKLTEFEGALREYVDDCERKIAEKIASNFEEWGIDFEVETIDSPIYSSYESWLRPLLDLSK